jgi:ferritin-like metal-binding protein YciE
MLMANEGLKELYIDELKDLYSAENQLVKALPKMAKAATSEDLRAGFEEHLEQTKGQVQRLETIFEQLRESPKGKKCKGMEGLIEEGSEAIEEHDGAVLDAALIGAAQRVEHYEIAGYGTVIAFAEELGESNHVSLLTKRSKRKRKRTRNSPDLLATSMHRQTRARKRAKKKPRRRKDPATQPSCAAPICCYKERRSRQLLCERRFTFFQKAAELGKLLRRVQRVLSAMFQVSRLMAGDQLNNTRP